MPFKNPADRLRYCRMWSKSPAGRAYQTAHRKRANENAKRYQSTEKAIVLRKKRIKEGYKKHPEKSTSRAKVFRAVRSGRIKKFPCKECGSLKSEGHHPDYTKPLEVIWLCRLHHLQLHARLREKKKLPKDWGKVNGEKF